MKRLALYVWQLTNLALAVFLVLVSVFPAGLAWSDAELQTLFQGCMALLFSVALCESASRKVTA